MKKPIQIANRKKVIRLNQIARAIIFYVLLFSAVCRPLIAEDLDQIYDIVNRPKSDRKKPEKEERLKDPWIPANSSLAKMWVKEGRGILIVLEWLGDFVLSEFKLRESNFRKYDEHLSMTAIFSAHKKKTAVTLTFLVPHPKYIDLLNVGLMRAFAELSPPGLSVAASEKMEIKNQDAYFYNHKNGDCSLLYKLPRQALLNLHNKGCKDGKALVQIAQLLSIERLKIKLDS